MPLRVVLCVCVCCVECVCVCAVGVLCGVCVVCGCVVCAVCVLCVVLSDSNSLCVVSLLSLPLDLTCLAQVYNTMIHMIPEYMTR